MKFDLYAHLAALKARPADGSLPAGLASGFVDKCTTVFHVSEVEREQSATEQQRKAAEQRKNDERRCYMQHASRAMLELKEFKQLRLDADVENLPDPSWIAFDIAFTLETPWYSKDDRPFHVLDNPVRKDRVFGVPFMSAASWKGLLRWSFRMTTGIAGPALQSDEEKQAVVKAMDLHLFGNEREEKKDFQRGALAFCPTWFSKLDFEVINPHSRARRAGTQPIYYEVVPAGAEGSLRLLYAPLPGAAGRDKVKPIESIDDLLDSIEDLLTKYGISAKRTTGWGTARIESWVAKHRGAQAVTAASLADFKQKVSGLNLAEETT